MKIVFNYDKDMSREELKMSTHPNNKHILKSLEVKILTLFESLNGYDDQNNAYLIPLISILYVEFVNRKIFAYTYDCYYCLHFSSLKILMSTIQSNDFTRISSSMLVNRNHIVSVKVIKGKKRLVLLSNGESLEVSREFSSNIDQWTLNQY